MPWHWGEQDFVAAFHAVMREPAPPTSFLPSTCVARATVEAEYPAP